jgi:hypothetical protein
MKGKIWDNPNLVSLTKVARRAFDSWDSCKDWIGKIFS